jgi:hypothetical protein
MATRRKRAKDERALYVAEIVKTDLESDTLEELLAGLLSLIKKCTEQKHKAKKRGNDDFFVQLGIEQNEQIDALLGCAFVLCQAHMTTIAARVVRAATLLYISSASKRSLVLTLGTKDSTKIIENIDLAANYFKHHGEWLSEWKVENGKRVRRWIKTHGTDKNGLPKALPAATTIALAEQRGLTPASPFNLQTLSGLLGIDGDDGFSGLQSLAQKIKVWHRELVEIVRNAKPKTIAVSKRT